MKKKLLITLLTMLALAACAIVFAACGSLNSCGSGGDEPGSSHTHTYSYAWSSDETYHWHAATCEHVNEVSGKAEHQIVIDSAVPATCYSEGKTEGSHCFVCGAVITEQKTTEKLAHEFSEWIVSTGCESDDTYTVRYCLECRYMEYDEDTVVIHPHSYEYIDSKEPTCTESGYSALFRCENCGYEITDEIEPLGHISGSVYYEDGDRHYSYCTRPGCGDKVYGSHNYHSWRTVKKPTCTGYGEKSAVCRYCDHVGYFPVSPQHTYDSGIVTKEPTCTGSGERLRTCVYCDATTTETISSLGHDYGAWKVTKESNCTETGERIRTCSRCRDVITEELPIQHTWGEWTTVKEFTCTEDGLKEHECLLCGAIERVTDPAHHIMVDGEIIEAPDCIHTGKQQQSCSVCGWETVVEVLELGHDIQRQTIDPTCIRAGYHTDTCSRCGEVTYIGIAALGHDWTISYDENTHREYCTRCDDVRSEGAHDIETIFRTTARENGYTFELLDRCSICGYEKSLAQTAVHIHNDAKIVSDGRATCTEEGLLPGLVCSTCGDILVKREKEPALGHEYKDSICVRCGDIPLELTLSKDGSYYIVTGIGEFTGSELTIPDSFNGIEIREIGDSAFEGCTNLTKIIISDTVTTIGYSAFSDCTGLTSVTIPSSVMSIGSYAFYHCTGLNAVCITDIAAWCAIDFGVNVSNPLNYAGNLYLNGELVTDLIIPDSVTSIGDSAFFGCDGLTSVTIPDSLTSIGNNAFYDCTELNAVYIMDLAAWCAIDFGSYYGGNPLSNAHNLYLNGELVTDLIIPDGVTSISDYAFYGCTGLTSVTIPDNVTSIGDNAFIGCTELNAVYITDLVAWCAMDFYSPYAYNLYLNGDLVTKLVIPDGVTSIGNGVFSGCIGLTSVTIPDSVTSIGDYAFKGCRRLTSITIPDSVTSIGDSAFFGCDGLTSVTIPDSVTSIGSSAFSGCDGLTSVTIPDGVTSIGNYAFEGCDGLTNIIIMDNVVGISSSAFDNTPYYNNESNWENGVLYIGKHLIKAKTTIPGTYTIKDGTRTIAGSAFYRCTELTSVTIPDSVTSIGGSAFAYCTGLTSVTIPDSVTSIGGSAFAYCTGLTSVTIPDGVTSIGGSAFAYCTGLTSITIPDSVTSIGDSAFEGCIGLKSVTIGSGVTSIGDDAFLDCTGLTEIYYNATEVDDLSYYSDLFENAGKSGNGITVTFGDSVKHIPANMFYENGNIVSVTIGNGVTSIGDSAFEDCIGLNAVYMTDIAAWCAIDFGDTYSNPIYYANNLYFNNELVTDLVVPDGVTSISDYAFYNYTGLTSVTIPDSVTSIGSFAFSGCIGLKSVAIGNGVTSISDYAFYNCTGLTSITIPDSVTSIGYRSFDGCTGFTSVTIGNGVTSIGRYAFDGCNGLTSVTFNNTSGWSVVNGASISSVDLSDPSVAATYLTSTYLGRVWTRS